MRTPAPIAGALSAVALAVLIPAAALAARTSPRHRIVPFVSMDGVKLGATAAQVRGVLGRPTSTIHLRDGGGVDYGYGTGSPHGGFDVVVQYGKVTQITTRNRDDRLPNGLHVGSSASAVHHRYHARNACVGIVCIALHGPSSLELTVTQGTVSSIALLTAPEPPLHAGQTRLIVPGSSIDGVRPGETRSQVGRTLGAFQRPVVHVHGGVVVLDYGDMTVFFDRRGRSTYVTTGDPADHTASGVHVGDGLAALRRAYRHGLACRGGVCSLTRSAGTRRLDVTSFSFAGDEIGAIAVGDESVPRRP